LARKRNCCLGLDMRGCLRVGGADIMVDGVERIEDRKFEFGSRQNGGTTVDFDNSEIDSGFDIRRTRLPNYALYLQDTVTVKPIMTDLTAGLRFDYHKFFYSHFSPRAGAVFYPSESHSVKVLYGQAFRAPIPRELLIEKSVTGRWTSGNRRLKPEVIETLELQYTLRLLKHCAASATYFYNSIDKMIEEDSTLKTYVNAGKQKTHGLEVGLDWKSKQWLAYANYSLIYAKDGRLKVREYGYPQHTANVGANFMPVQHLWLGARMRYVGEGPRKAYSGIKWYQDYRPYAVVDATVGVKDVVDGLRVSLNAANVLDTRYVTPVDKADADSTYFPNSGFLGPERSLRVELTYDF
ncbi:TonB-dependent receptor domain-containing protein, partial [Planctomycetota bacterium]